MMRTAWALVVCLVPSAALRASAPVAGRAHSVRRAAAFAALDPEILPKDVALDPDLLHKARAAAGEEAAAATELERLVAALEPRIAAADGRIAFLEARAVAAEEAAVRAVTAAGEVKGLIAMLEAQVREADGRVAAADAAADALRAEVQDVKRLLSLILRVPVSSNAKDQEAATLLEQVAKVAAADGEAAAAEANEAAADAA